MATRHDSAQRGRWWVGALVFCVVAARTYAGEASELMCSQCVASDDAPTGSSWAWVSASDETTGSSLRWVAASDESTASTSCWLTASDESPSRFAFVADGPKGSRLRWVAAASTSCWLIASDETTPGSALRLAVVTPDDASGASPGWVAASDETASVFVTPACALGEPHENEVWCPVAAPAATPHRTSTAIAASDGASVELGEANDGSQTPNGLDPATDGGEAESSSVQKPAADRFLYDGDLADAVEDAGVTVVAGTPESRGATDGGVADSSSGQNPAADRSLYDGDLADAVEDAGVTVVDGTPESRGATDGGVAEAAEDAGVSRETVVVGTPESRTAGSAHTIGGARLKRFELDDAMALLQAVPGVQVRGEDGFGLRPNIGLRGANPDRSKKVTLMEDGVLFGPAPYSAPAAYFFPLVTRMESVRVIKGPAAIIYGPQTVGGAIDFITRDTGPGMSAGLDLALGQWMYGKGHGYFSVGNDTTSFVLEGVHLRSDGFKHIVELPGANTGFTRNEWMMKGRHRVTLGGLSNVFTLKLGIATEESNETYLGLSDEDFRADPLRRYVTSRFDHMTNQRTTVSLQHRLEGDGFTLVTTAYRHDFHRTWRKVNHLGGADISSVLTSPNAARNQLYMGVLRGELDSQSALETLYIGPNRRDFVSQGVESIFRTNFTTGPLIHALEARARLHFDSIQRLHTEDGFLLRGGELVRDDQPTTVLVSGLDSTFAVALSAQDAIRWGRVTLTPGVRAELIFSSSQNNLKGTLTTANTNVLLPGIGAYVSITEQLGVLAGVYRGFSPPNPGVQGALPELAMNVEGGARWSRSGERLEAIGFFNDYANLTDTCTFSNGCDGENLDRQFNAGRAHIYGLEVFGEKRLRLGEFTVPLSVAYTLTGSRLLTSFRSDDPVLGNAQEGDELAYLPRHMLNVAAGVDWWRFSAHAQFTFIDRMREVAGQGDFNPAWTTDVQATLDVHLGFKLTSWASVYFDARNLFDQHAIVGRRPFGARPNAPRTLIGGLKLTY